jgi:para-aminobenzoate synthetase component 1
MESNKFSPADFEKLLKEGNGFRNFCFLNSNGAQQGSYCGLTKYDFLAGINALDSCEATVQSLPKLEAFIQKNKGKWMFGFLSYELKNEIESLTSSHTDRLNFPVIHFFVPQVVLTSEQGVLNMVDQHEQISRQFVADDVELRQHPRSGAIELIPRFSKEEYTSTLSKLKNELQQGNIYEVTFCQEFYNDAAAIQPFETYIKLNAKTRAPMSCFYKKDNQYIISSSPERFLCRRGNTLFSQPIKGTASCSASREEDDWLKEQLLNNEKERAENIMIVDLVRNDLSRIALPGSVNVNELLGLYSFKTVHQLISTISCNIDPQTSFTDLIKATFPMGSMTGAPKISAMQLIDAHEKTNRGLFSGSVGYIDPNGDFDFNVIIRSILYNAQRNYVSVQAGGAITIQSDAEAEYEESMLKAKAMMDVLG